MYLAKKILVVVFLMICLTVFALIVYYRASRHTPISPMIPTVSVSVVNQEVTQGQVTAVGTLQPYQGVSLTAQEDAVVSNIYFSSNDSVKAGDVVLKQETDIQLAAMRQVQAELMLAKANYERSIDLYKKHYLSQQEFEQLQEKYLYAQAAYNQAQAELNKHIVTAPFAGQLGIFDVQEGDYASTGKVFVTLTNLDKLSLDFYIAEKYINQVKKGDEVQIKSAIDPNRTFTATIHVLDNVINDKTYMLKVQAIIDNKNHFLKPGGFANITVYYGPKQNVLTVPQMAIVYSNKGNAVYKVTNDTAYKTPVTLGEQVGQSIIVKTGLNERDVIVSAGTNKLHDGMPITLSNQVQQ